MNKELFEKVKKLNLPAGKYALFGSAPMGVRGLRECHDADIIVLPEIFQVYLGQPGWELKKMWHGSEYLFNDGVELWIDWKPGIWDIAATIGRAEMIEGLPFVSLEDVTRWKELSGRGKDLKDVEIIKRYLKGNEKRN